MIRRILASMLAATVVALVVLGLPLAIAIGRLYRSQAVTQLQREATLAAGAVPDTGLTGPDPVEPPPGATAPTRFGYYSQAGRLVSGVGPPSADATTRIALRRGIGSATDHGQLVVSAPITVGEQTDGAVRASLPVGALQRRIHRAWAAIAALGLGALGLAAIIGRSEARRLATPVRNLSAAMDRLGQGDFNVRVGTTTGIPEVDRAGSALDVTAENLGRLLERERAFSANASHQLRTPLAALRITLESALITNHQNPDDTLTAAIAELDRLEATVQELLAHARDTTRTRELVDFDAILSVADRRWHNRVTAAGRLLRVEAEGLPPTRASSTAIGQIIDVLIDNAVNHGEGTVTLRARRAGAGVAIDVADEGPGVEEDFQSAVDRRTRRTGLTGRSDGHGIGLALARSLAQAEGGQLVLRRAGPRPIFSLILPAERQPDLVTGPRSVEPDGTSSAVP